MWITKRQFLAALDDINSQVARETMQRQRDYIGLSKRLEHTCNIKSQLGTEVAKTQAQLASIQTRVDTIVTVLDQLGWVLESAIPGYRQIEALVDERQRLQANLVNLATTEWCLTRNEADVLSAYYQDRIVKIRDEIYGLVHTGGVK